MNAFFSRGIHFFLRLFDQPWFYMLSAAGYFWLALTVSAAKPGLSTCALAIYFWLQGSMALLTAARLTE